MFSSSERVRPAWRWDITCEQPHSTTSSSTAASESVIAGARGTTRWCCLPPRSYSGLPGLPVPGDPDGYPTRDEIADYLEGYADHFDLPVVLGTGVRRIERIDGGFQLTTDAGERVAARSVVFANGAFQKPAVPATARQLSPVVPQLTAQSYRHPAQIAPGTVLVVGDGATGRQIARELAPTHDVHLATGKARRVIPQRVLGRSIFWWMDRLGVLRASRRSPFGRYLMRADPFPGKELGLAQLREHGVTIHDRLLRMEDRRSHFADGGVAAVDAVIWATGYRDDSAWVDISEARDVDGVLIHHDGVSPVAGLYVIGRSWQRTRGSALLYGVGDDAAAVALRITDHLAERAAARSVAMRAAAV
jgi:putative flavoprotein involved in K+ transport